MKRANLLSVAAATALALAGCNKGGGASTANTETSNTTTTASAGNTGGNAGGMGSPGQAKPVNDLQDAAAGPVGLASASTLGSHDTGAFVTNAAISDMYEIQAGKLAQQKSQSAAVKKFAAQIVKDHTATSSQLKSAVAKGVKAQIPTELDQRRKGMIDNLTASQGKDFDTRFAAQQTAAHQEAVTLFTGYAKNGDNAQLKTWAGQTAPKLQMHLDMAKQLTSSAGGGGGSGGNTTG
jgi:putative membrane protein